jgi:hypothetical protein
VLASAVSSFVWFSNTEKKPFSSALETSLSTSGRGGDSVVPLGLGHGADLDYSGLCCRASVRCAPRQKRGAARQPRAKTRGARRCDDSRDGVGDGVVSRA